MTEREARMARKRLCTAACTREGTYYPNVCQKCKSPCKYGTQLLAYNGIPRQEPKETPGLRVADMRSERAKRAIKGYNRYSIVRR